MKTNYLLLEHSIAPVHKFIHVPRLGLTAWADVATPTCGLFLRDAMEERQSPSKSLPMSMIVRCPDSRG